MTHLKLVDDYGKAIVLGSKIAEGGYGIIYKISNDTNSCAKLYKPEKVSYSEIRDKLIYMGSLRNDQLKSVSAWPEKTIRNASSGESIGFTMTFLDGFQPIQQLYNPIQRIKCFPRATWAMQIRAAYNLAAAFDEVHKTGCVVGDVNQSNALVSHKAIVRLIDCDSFQFKSTRKHYLCEAGTPHYTPPELQGKTFRGLVRTENHDRFGLAVLIYQLLFVGRHPYAGVYSGPGDPSFDQFIAKFMFSQGPRAASWGMAPAPHTPIFKDISDELGSLFRRAFESGSEKDQRPKPKEWLTALSQFESNVKRCSVDHGHFHMKAASDCVWCRIGNGGPEYYYGASPDSSSFEVDQARIDEVIKRLKNAELPDFNYFRPQSSSSNYQPQQVSLDIQLLLKAYRAQEAILSQQQHAFEVEKNSKLQALQIALRNTRTELQAQRDRKLAEIQTQRDDNVSKLQTQREDKLAEVNTEHDEAKEQEKHEERERNTFLTVLLCVVAVGIFVAMAGFRWKFLWVSGLASAGLFAIWACVYAMLIPHLRSRRTYWQYQHRRDEINSDYEHSHKQIEGNYENGYKQIVDSYELSNGQIDADYENKRQEFTVLYAKRLKPYFESVAIAKQQYLAKAEGEVNRRRALLLTAESQLQSEESAMHSAMTMLRQDHCNKVYKCKDLLEQVKGIRGRYDNEVTELYKNAEKQSLLRHLRLHSISDAEISKVGPTRKQVLVSYGIYTAAEVELQVIYQIPGFGDVLARSIMDWKQGVERTHRFDKKAVVASSEHSVVAMRYKGQYKQVFDDLRSVLGQVESLFSKFNELKQSHLPRIQKLCNDHEQRKADYDHLTTRDAG